MCIRQVPVTKALVADNIESLLIILQISFSDQHGSDAQFIYTPLLQILIVFMLQPFFSLPVCVTR